MFGLWRNLGKTFYNQAQELCRMAGDDIPTFEANLMPRSTVRSLAKTVLNEDTNIQKDALTALVKGSTVFISYLASHANEIAHSKKRKTIMPNDVFEALKVIEYDRFTTDLREEFGEFPAKKAGKSLEAVDDGLPSAKKARLNDAEVDVMETTDEAEAVNNDAEENIDEEEQDEAEEEEEEEEEEEGEEVIEDAEEEEEDDDIENEVEDDEEEADIPAIADIIDPSDDIDPDRIARQDTYDEALDDEDDSD